MSKDDYVYVIPCSGIGKSLGSVGRKAAYKVTEKLRSKDTKITCLALLTAGDKEILLKIREHPCISIDGCPTQCSKKNIEASGGKFVTSIMVTDILRNHKELKPDGIIKLNPDGEKLANLVADATVKEVDKARGGTN